MMTPSFLRLPSHLAWASVLSAAFLFGCGPSLPSEQDWPGDAKRWYERAVASYQTLDLEDARSAVSKALQDAPEREEAVLLGAQVALAQLDYDATVEFLQNTTGSQAHSLRGRAYWYAGRVSDAAKELEALLSDPAVKDPWAEGVLKLARQGAGREPFAVRGSLLAVMEMPRLETTAMIIPLELNGQPVLGMLSTSSAEVIVDASDGRDPSWVSVRFDGRVEVKDVPALTQDLTGLSREVNVPIKVLLGTNILRHLNATFDLLGSQFVVRTFEPPPPPEATRVPVQYVRGGGMVIRGQVGVESEAPAFNFFIDTASTFALALDKQGWSKTRVDLANLIPVEGEEGMRQARLSQVKLGAFGVPSVTAVSGVGFSELEKTLGIEVDGLLGSGLLGQFRVTLADGGRTLWLEDLPKLEFGPPPATVPAPDPGLQPLPTLPAPSPSTPG